MFISEIHAPVYLRYLLISLCLSLVHVYNCFSDISVFFVAVHCFCCVPPLPPPCPPPPPPPLFLVYCTVRTHTVHTHTVHTHKLSKLVFFSFPAGSCSPLDNRWKMYGGACYFVQEGAGDSAMTWREARSWCNSMHTELVSITSLQEQLFVRSLVKTVLCEAFQHEWHCCMQQTSCAMCKLHICPVWVACSVVLQQCSHNVNCFRTMECAD